MPDLLLWRRLTETDFDAINGQAAPSGTGGGAMHIALGRDRDELPIVSFLGGVKGRTATIDTQRHPPSVPKATLTFDGNPSRRSGEWRITDQFTHRHPAWTTDVGFPNSYEMSDRQIVFVVRQGNQYHARFSTEKNLRVTIPSLAALIDKNTKMNTGIVRFDPAWGAGLNVVSHVDNLAAYAQLSKSPEIETAVTFDPKNIEDGRQKTLADVVRRQGQPAFRKKLLAAYKKHCAISVCDVEATLHAAHITPYRGPETNHPSNGILLRADIHTLFDLGLITIDPKHMTLFVSAALKGTEYAKLSGKKIALPEDPKLRPSQYALAEHNTSFKP